MKDVAFAAVVLISVKPLPDVVDRSISKPVSVVEASVQPRLIDELDAVVAVNPVGVSIRVVAVNSDVYAELALSLTVRMR